MKGMKGKLLKKMTSIGTIGYLKLQDRVLQVSASDGYYLDSCPKNFDVIQVQNKLLSCEETEQKKKINRSCLTEQEPDVIDGAELMKDLEEDEEMELIDETDDKENVGPTMAVKCSGCLKPNREISLGRISEASELFVTETENRRQAPLLEIDVSSFRRPDLNSYSLFDPNLLAAFKQAVMEYTRMTEAERKIRIEDEEFENIEEDEEEEEEEEQEPPLKAPRVEVEIEEDPLLKFDEKCPPGGEDLVILYTTTLRGIRKTFEGCNSIRFLLESFRVVYFERDVSMHSEFREELRRIFYGKAVVPPKLFIRGRYIGGAEEVLGLHEQGKLRPLFKTVPIDRSNGPCEGCGGIRFVLCFSCNGSHKVIAEDGQYNNCSNCNENGLIICPICC